MKTKERKHLINEEIKNPQIRLPEIGVVDLNEALSLANSQNMDLVLFNVDNNNVGICKILKYEKFLYEQIKNNKPKKIEIKEIKIGPNISENDLNYRINHIIDFLKKGHKVKITMEFRGREMSYIDNAKTLFLNFLVKLEEFSIAEFMPKLEGKKMFTVIRPKTK